MISLLGLAIASCGSPPETKPAFVEPPPRPAAEVEAILAASKTCPAGGESPVDYPGLHNVSRLSARVLTGSSPEGEAGFARLAALGVKTVISVDGARPNVEAAARHGLVYVHVPVGYHGIDREQQVRLVKTARELPTPVYIHCHHGKHRGPTAGALVRMAVDDAAPAVAVAEMRRSGAAETYAGLYRSAAGFHVPSREETAALAYSFPAAEPTPGLQQSMVKIDDSADRLKAGAGRGFATDEKHPDVASSQEALIIAEALREIGRLPETAAKPPRFTALLKENETIAWRLRDQLAATKADAAAADIGAAKATHEALRASCEACHKEFRNVK
ncbi:MAG: hypothetical protein HY719_09060 [Planctomycetes bacterium]|nr:hypothetical protein [Planctomycetota bacterium]